MWKSDCGAATVMYLIVARIYCGSPDEMSCEVHGQQYPNGATWQDNCTHCVCHNGVSNCETVECQPLPSCGVMQVPEGDCCPVCVGCRSRSGALYSNAARWQEDPCTSCTCVNGQSKCRASLCQVTCLKPRHVEGECCPVCDDDDCNLYCIYGYEEDSEGQVQCKCKAPPVCLPMNSCTKNCSYGYRRNQNGCEICKCNRCKGLTGCRKICLHGYLTNDKGCSICKCRDTPEIDQESQEKATSEVYNPSVERICTSPEGHRREEGEMWSDGCHICYCHGGVEMCTLITCAVPNCKSPVLHPGECCPSCPDDPQFIQPNITVCHAVDGTYHVEGETWSIGPCTKCLCHHGQALCDIQTCPPAPCPDAEVKAGECCPSCPFFHLVAKSPGMPLRASCLDGSTDGDGRYMDGDMWRIGPCKSCLCHQGNMSCFNEKCPPTLCTHSVLRKNQCCPVCLDNTVVQACQHENATYAPDERWMIDECTRCHCSNGQVTCTEKTCSVSCPDPVKVPDRCCPVCVETKTGEKINIPAKGSEGTVHTISDLVGDSNVNSAEDVIHDGDADVSQVAKLPPSNPSAVALDPFCIVLIVILFSVMLILGVAVYVISLWCKRLQKKMVLGSEGSFATKASYTAYQPPVTTYKDPKSRVKYYYDKCNGEADCKRPISEVLIAKNLDAAEKSLTQV